jgi:hypothetical protein
LGARCDRLIPYLTNSVWFWIVFSLHLWIITIAIVLDFELLACASYVSGVVFYVWIFIVSIDLRRWRLVLATPKNVVIFLGSFLAFTTTFLLPIHSVNSHSVALRVQHALCFLGCATTFPFLEIMDLPIAVTFLVYPAVVSMLAIIALKFHTTGIFCFTELGDYYYSVGCQQFSVLQMLNSIITLTMFLVISKIRLVWSLSRGKPMLPFRAPGYVRVVTSDYDIDSRSYQRPAVAYHLCMGVISLLLLLVQSMGDQIVQCT